MADGVAVEACAVWDNPHPTSPWSGEGAVRACGTIFPNHETVPLPDQGEARWGSVSATISKIYPPYPRAQNLRHTPLPTRIDGRRCSERWPGWCRADASLRPKVRDLAAHWRAIDVREQPELFQKSAAPRRCRLTKKLSFEAIVASGPARLLKPGRHMANRCFALPKPHDAIACLLYTSPSPRDGATSRMPSSA